LQGFDEIMKNLNPKEMKNMMGLATQFMGSGA